MKTVSLGDVGRVVTGKTPPKANPEFWGDNLDFVTPTDFREDARFIKPARRISNVGANKMKNLICPQNSVMVTCIGSDMGKVALTKRPTITNQQINTIVIDASNFDPEFVYYLLKTNRPLLRKFAEGGGSTMPIISKSSFEKLEFIVPDIENQKKIVDIISKIDDRIELNRRMNETLEQMGQALFKHYFIDNPSAKTWPKVTLGDICDRVGSGGTPSTKRNDYYSGDVDWFTTKELNDKFLKKSDKSITMSGLGNSAAKLFPSETILVAIYAAPTVGRLGILTREGSFNQAACGLVANKKYGYEFVYLYLLLSRKALNDQANGAAQQNISVGAIRIFPVINPPADVLSEFHYQITGIFQRIKINTSQIECLVELRDSFLPRLILGKIKI